MGLKRLKLSAAAILLFLSFSVQGQGDPGGFTFNVDRFEVEGDNPLGDKAQKILKPYVGEQFGLEGLSAAADGLEQALIKAGYSFHRVSLPPQELDKGVIRLEVIRFAIDAVKVSGNEHFDEANILGSVPQLQVGGTPNTQALSRAMKMANNHASKKITLKFRESEKGEGISAELGVKDQSPHLIFISADNTGSEETEEIRTTIGYQHGNLFNRDHSLTATVTVAPEDPDATTQYGLNYHIPMYSHGATLDFLVSDSEINSGEVANNTAVTGKGQVAGFTYTRPFLTDSNVDHNWHAGFQYKNFENEIVGAQVPDLLSVPLDIGYRFNWKQRKGALSGGFKVLTNLETGNSQDNDYLLATGRVDVTSEWTSYRYNLAYDRLIGQSWMGHLGLSGQQSDDILISGEQFGVGGSRSLRGFEERSMLGDSGYEVSAELWFPPAWGMRFLVFVDHANVERNRTTVDPGSSFDLQSAGLGMRWSWKQQLSLSIDYGRITKGILATEDTNLGRTIPINLKDDDKAHVSLVYRF